MNPSTARSPLTVPGGYADWLAQLKSQITQAQQRASLAVNAELVQLYDRIEHHILQRQQTQDWGANVVDRLARYLKDSFPDMRFFAQHCPSGLFDQQAADQLPWFHIVNRRGNLPTHLISGTWLLPEITGM